MRGDERFPKDQAEMVFQEPFVEYLLELTDSEREQVLTDIKVLFVRPAGTHPLSNKNTSDQLAGLNTLYALSKEHRVVFASRVVKGVGVIDVLCGGQRKGSAIYDVAGQLVKTGALTESEVAQLWDALELLDILEEDLGLDAWDYTPPVARKHLVGIAVKLGILDEDTASVLSDAEINAALEAGFSPAGDPDPQAALAAAMRKARARATYSDASQILRARLERRCGDWMPRARARCIRRENHPGAHRSR